MRISISHEKLILQRRIVHVARISLDEFGDLFVGHLHTLVTQRLAHLGVHACRVDERDFASAVSLLIIVQKPDVGGTASVLEQVGRHRDDGIEHVALENQAAHFQFT